MDWRSDVCSSDLTILGRFGAGGIPSLRRIPFNVHIKGQTVGGTGYWVGEGKPKPVTKFGYNDTYHGWFKVAAISVLTDELIRFSDPSAENYVRDALADVLVARMDTDFIDRSEEHTSELQSLMCISYSVLCLTKKTKKTNKYTTI